MSTSETLTQEFPPATPGHPLTEFPFIADLEANGKAKWVLSQEIVDERGQVVATTDATYFGMAH